MVKFTCKNHGINCEFEVNDEISTSAIEKFRNHVMLEHGIKFSAESLMQYVLGVQINCPYCNSEFETKEKLSKHIDKIHHGSGILEGDTRNF